MPIILNQFVVYTPNNKTPNAEMEVSTTLAPFTKGGSLYFQQHSGGQLGDVILIFSSIGYNKCKQNDKGTYFEIDATFTITKQNSIEIQSTYVKADDDSGSIVFVHHDSESGSSFPYAYFPPGSYAYVQNFGPVDKIFEPRRHPK